MDLFFSPDQEESVLFLNEEPLLFNDEPQIVKQLREEELQGKLPMWLADFDKENRNDFLSEEQDSTKEISHDQSKES